MKARLETVHEYPSRRRDDIESLPRINPLPTLSFVVVDTSDLHILATI